VQLLTNYYFIWRLYRSFGCFGCRIQSLLFLSLNGKSTLLVRSWNVSKRMTS